ncbi:hypothetical protein GCK72_021224 [Caenorhabditis remanei]|uniref:DUF38 domain-containing protein n=1 Tax=Caenorhabditis remanei TaxID=31234 RepID=A0A6A5GJ80_CAERE|nr:hypothetical protein GCK72_021224 [Caenorhabditis remanei]KAF1754661.1 hypothetical protein GCK72_021224 [Caenorhabditis remanei]
MPFFPQPLSSHQKASIKEISVTLHADIICLWLNFFCLSSGPIKIQYQQEESNTTVLCKKKNFQAFLEDTDFVTVLREDLAAILDESEPELQELHIGFQESEEQIDRVYTSIQNVIKTRKDKLKVKNINLEIKNVEQLTSVLQYLDSETLKTVDLSLKGIVDLRNVLELDAWKEKNGLEMNVALHSFSVMDLEALKEILIQQPTFDTVTIYYDHLQQDALESLHHQPLGVSHYPNSHKISFSRVHLISPPNIVPQMPSTSDSVSGVFGNYVIMRNVLKYVGGVDIQSLRKVSRTIRNRVDFIREDPEIQKMNISLKEHGKIRVAYDDSKQIIYEKYGFGCSIGQQYIPQDYRLVFMNDFEIMLRNQQDVIKTARLNFSKDPSFMEMFKDHLKSRDQLLKVEALELEVSSQYEVLSVLQFINPPTLKTLNIQASVSSGLQIGIDEVMKLEQWNNLENLVINSLIISTPLPEISFGNLVNVEILVECISMDDLFYLKENILNSTRLNKFKIRFNFFSDSNNQNEQWPDFDQDETGTWAFRIPNMNQYLSVLYLPFQSVTFCRTEMPPEMGIMEIEG